MNPEMEYLKPVRKIMIVDDDGMVNLVTEKLLLRYDKGYEIITYTNPVKAIESLKTKHDNKEPLPDIILLDIRMPQLNGFEFLDTITQFDFFKTIQVIMYTSSYAVPDQEKSRNYVNVIGYMQKPFSVDIYKSILDGIMQQP